MWVLVRAAGAAAGAETIEHTTFTGEAERAGLGAAERQSTTWCGCPPLSLACRLAERLACAQRSGEWPDMKSSARPGDEMKTQSKKEIAMRMLVLLLFVVFGFCVPGYAATKGTPDAARRES